MNGLLLLAGSAAGVGMVHALLGPDHYLPFVVLARARRWSWRRTAAITLACGGAHVLSSLALAAIGIGLGLTVKGLGTVESRRGELAAWALIAVGLLYGAWGLHRALRGDRHLHLHPHPLAHAHAHQGEHVHGHDAELVDETRLTGEDARERRPADSLRLLSPWMLFLVFVLGPCEPLIPLLLVPAAVGSALGTALVAASFGAATLLAMLAAVSLGRAGASLLRLGRLERYAHALAGGAIAVSGLGVALLGW